MKQKLGFLFALSFCSSFVFAAKDVTTEPEFYFLKESQSINSLKLLPSPPDENSIEFDYDKELYKIGKSIRKTERGKQAAIDANVENDGIPKMFSESFGTEISAEKTPEIFKLIRKMREDAGDLATRDAKRHYMRVRPFAYYNEPTCARTEEGKLSTNGSYPSGHTSIGWATALVLAEINPDRQNEILKRGFEVGESRVICGYHWQSDIHAGRTVGAAIVARLHAEPTFIAQLNRAKNEFNQIYSNNLNKQNLKNFKPLKTN